MTSPSRWASTAPSGSAGEEHLERDPAREETGEPLGAAGAGEEAELDLGDAEARVVGRHPEVAREGELEPAAERGAVDRGDRRLRVLLEPVEDVGERAHEPREAGGAVEPGQLADVGAGAERPPLAGDHERAHAVVGLEVDQRGVERGEGVGADRVETIGPAQRDDRDRALASFDPQHVAPIAHAHAIVSPPLTDRVCPVM